MWQQWVNFILGLWVAAIPMMGGVANPNTLVISGIAIAALALWGALYERSEAHRERVEHREHRTA